MKAIPYEADNPYGGDHRFYASDNAIDYTEGDTFESLVATLMGEGQDPEFESGDEPDGFWIVTDEGFAAVQGVWPAEGVGNDSACYQLPYVTMLKEAGFEVNAASKRVAHSMAVAVITAEGIKHLQNLPLTTETVRAASDELDKVFDTDAIENAMEPYFEALVEQIAAAHDLSDDQRTELESRLAYRWELLPLTEGE